MSDNLIIIGFDSEWVAQDDTSNHVLSYQYAVKVGSEMHRGIVYTEGAEKEHRWKLATLMGHAIEEARAEGVIGRLWPRKIWRASARILDQFRREEEREEKKAARGFTVILGSDRTEAKVYNTR